LSLITLRPRLDRDDDYGYLWGCQWCHRIRPWVSNWAGCHVSDDFRRSFNFAAVLPSIGSTMSYFSAFEGIPGVRRVVVGDAGGSVLDAMGGITSEAENTAGLAAVVSRQLISIGQTLRLGVCEFIAVRSQISALAFLPRGGTLATLEIDPKRLSSEVEAKLRSADWTARGNNRPTSGPAPVPPAVWQVQAAKSGAAPVRPPIGRTIGSETGASRPPTSENIRVALPPSEAMKRPDVTRPNLPAAPPLPPPIASAFTSLAADSRSKTKAAGSLPASWNGAMFSGDIQMVCVPDLLEFCRNGQRTGVLLCSSGEGTGRVRLRRGMIFDASSPKTSTTTLLRRLVDSGDASEEQVRDMALSSEDEADNVVVAQRLINGGFTDPESVRKAVCTQVQTAIEEMLHWTDGRFAFHPATLESQPSEPAVEIDPQVVLLRIFKEQDEAAR